MNKTDTHTDFLKTNDKESIESGIERRLEYLGYLKQSAAQRKYVIDSLLHDIPLTNPSPDQTYLPANTAYKVSESKKRAVTAGTPDLEYVALDDAGELAVIPLKNLFEYKWTDTDSDRVYSLAVRDAFRYGNGWLYEGYKQIKGKDRKLVKQGDELVVKEEDKIFFDDIFCEHLEYDEVFRDGKSIGDANEVAIIRTFKWDKFIRDYQGRTGFSFSLDDIPKGKKYYFNLEDQSNILFETNLNTDESYSDLVTVVEYFNKSLQAWIVTANGVWINPLKGGGYYPIPTADGKLPIKEVVDIYEPSRVYDIGEIELCLLDIRGIDSARNLKLDTAKAKLGIMVVDSAEGEFDVDRAEFGTTFMRADDPNSIKFFAPNPDTSLLERSEDDFVKNIIEKTQIDFRILDLNGTEQEVNITNEERYSTNKAIKDFILTNSKSFWLDWANSRIANIITYFDSNKTKIPLKGFTIDKDGKARPSEGEYGTFDINPDIFKAEISIIPKFDSIISDSTDKKKKQLLEFYQLVGNAKDPETNKFIYDVKRMTDQLGPYYGVNTEQITASNEVNLSGADLRKKLEGSLMQPTDNPDEIPPEQRTPNTKQIQPLSGSNTDI